ncbi:MAG: electron transport complex subunit RsxC, partial [Candidatus Omnitrophota bacterium]
TVFMSQHLGSPAELIVKPGDEILRGQIIAKTTGFVSANVHSPVTGKVLKVEYAKHPILKHAEAVIIGPDYTKPRVNFKPKDTIKFSKEEILNIIKESGIVGMGGATFPTHVKLMPKSPVDTLIINGSECEPYLATDCRVMLEYTNEILKGVEILAKLLDVKTVIFGIAENKPRAIKLFEETIENGKYDFPLVKIAELNAGYPQGGEKQLINIVTKRKVPPRGLPMDVGCVVHNVGTCLAVYDAVYKGKPFIERLVTFCGDALKEPKNVWVTIGTNLKELFDSNILEFKTAPKKIICGGPMMGIALDSLDYPIIKGSGGFVFLSHDEAEVPETPCLSCSRCVDVCPMNLLPNEFVRAVKAGEYELLEDMNLIDCMECGCCVYSCPAKIPVVHYVRMGKQFLRNHAVKEKK